MSMINKVKFIAGRTSLKIRKHSPEIFLGVGLITFVATVVTASKATLKIEGVINEHLGTLTLINENAETDGYTEEDAKKDKVVLYSKTAVKIAKEYAPAIAFGITSFGCILYSYKLINGRYIAAVGAYNGLSEVFKTYRKRVIEAEGKDRDEYYRFGTVKRSIAVPTKDEKGNETSELKEHKFTDLDKPGVGAIFFDESSREWDRNPTLNMYFLKSIENMFTDKLRTRGHVFLNEVYDALGFDHTQEGALIGWLLGAGDDYVDFGLYKTNEQCRRFVNGQDNIILLDFNHDGIIWDKIS